jgi:hypothetical protein
MRRINIFLSLTLILLGTLVFSPVVDAKAVAKKAVEFGFNSVQQLTVNIADVKVAENYILIKEGKGANKKVLTSGAIIVKVTDAGAQVATISDLVKGQQVHVWMLKKMGPNKSYQGLIISQFLGVKALASVPPTVQFSAVSSEGLENITPSISVSLSKAATKDVRVAYTVSGTATGGGVDYTLANGELVITKGQTMGLIPLVVVNESAQEADETVVVTLTSSTVATLGSQKVHTYTIKDDDQSGVGFETTTSSGAESATSVNFRVALSGTSTAAVQVAYAVTGTATGGGVDYTLANGTLTIPAGQTGANITATVVDDTAIESAETIIVTLSSPVGATLSANTVMTYTINDNDLPTIGFGSAASAGAEGTSTVSIPVTLSVVSPRETRVNYAVTGTASGSGVDYTLANGTVTIAAGQTTANIPLTVVNDTIDELDETVIITLSSPVDATLGATAVHTYTIQDDDNPVVQFSMAAASGTVDTTPVNIVVTLSAIPAAAVQVNYAVTGGTAVSGVDYTLASGTLTMQAAPSANIPLTIINYPLAGNKTIIVTLSNPVNATLGATSVHTYTTLPMN